MIVVLMTRVSLIRISVFSFVKFLIKTRCYCYSFFKSFYYPKFTGKPRIKICGWIVVI